MNNTGKAIRKPKGGAVNKRPATPKVKQDNRHSQKKAKQCGDRYK